MTIRPDLGPIAGDEMTVAELIGYVHEAWCGSTENHNAQCNTLRLLAEDQRSLAARIFGRTQPDSETRF